MLKLSSGALQAAAAGQHQNQQKRTGNGRGRELKVIHMVLANTLLDESCYLLPESWTVLHSLAV